MLKYGNKEFRNLEEQVGKNKADIEALTNGVIEPKVIVGPQGPQGAKGEQGVGIKNITQSYNDIKIELTNGKEYTIANVKGERGLVGPKGETGIPGKTVATIQIIGTQTFKTTDEAIAFLSGKTDGYEDKAYAMKITGDLVTETDDFTILMAYILNDQNTYQWQNLGHVTLNPGNYFTKEEINVIISEQDNKHIANLSSDFAQANINYNDVTIQASGESDDGEGNVSIIANDKVIIANQSEQITMENGDIYTNSSYEPLRDESIATKKYVDEHSGGGGGGELPYRTMLTGTAASNKRIIIRFDTSRAITSFEDLKTYLIDNGNDYTVELENTLLAQYPDFANAWAVTSGPRLNIVALEASGFYARAGSSPSFLITGITYARSGTHALASASPQTTEGIVVCGYYMGNSENYYSNMINESAYTLFPLSVYSFRKQQ